MNESAIVPIESAQIPTRIFKTLATVAALQNYLIIIGLLVTRKRQRWQGNAIFAQKVGVFCLKKESKTGSSPDYSLFLGREKSLRSKIEGIPIKDRSQGDTLFHGVEQTGRRYLLGSKVPSPWGEGTASEGRMCRLRPAKVRAS